MPSIDGRRLAVGIPTTEHADLAYMEGPCPVQDPRLPIPRNFLRTDQVVHPEHPTAVGGLPTSKPGLDAGTHDLREDYDIADEDFNLRYVRLAS